MNDMFSFEESAWELYARKLRSGDRVSAAELLAMLEGQSDEDLEDAFDLLEERLISLDICMLPKAEPGGEIAKRLALEARLAKKRLEPANLPEGDPLRLYLEELAAIPVCGDEEVLALELAEKNRQEEADPDLQTRLLNLSLARVLELTKEFTGDRGVLLLDLIQEGSMGLWKGLQSYTGQKPFGLYRDWWIRQYMARAVTLQARETGMGSKLRKALEDYRAADRKLLTDLGRNPTLEEIARQMQITAEDAQVYEDMLRTAQMMEKAHTPAPEQTPEDEQAVEDTAYFQSRQRVADMLSSLTPLQAQVLALRFGLEGEQPYTPQQAGMKLGLTAEEVVALETDALVKLRGQEI